MEIQKILSNPNSGKWAMRICRWLPPAGGKWIASQVSRRIVSQQQSSLLQSIRANQWVAGGEKSSASELDQQAYSVLKHTGFSFYHLFHYYNDPVKLQALVDFTPDIEEIIARSKEKRHGLLVAGIHISNFDLVTQATILHGLQAFALSVPEPDQAIQWQHDLRRGSGVEILDANLANLRKTIQRLQDGELVITGVDRPIPDPKIKPTFFGRPAHLAVHHVQIAIRAKVPVIVLAGIRGEDERYHFVSSGEIHMKSYSDHQAELKINTERILEVTEDIIRHNLDQWAIFQPVWPEVLPLVPSH